MPVISSAGPYTLAHIPDCLGHAKHHPENPVGVEYPEIHKVLEGKANFLLQKILLQKRTLEDIVLVRATAGDLVCIPPGYGHVTINPSSDVTLSMANLVSTRFESEYAEYERLRGAAYYELVVERLEKNPQYPQISEIRIVDADKCPRLWEGSHASLYDFVGDDSMALFLNPPDKVADRFGNR